MARAGRLLRTQPASAWTVFGITFFLYWIYSTRQWSQYSSPSWDLGIFTQVVQRYAHLQAPVVHIKGADYNILGDHFHPILALLAPFYAVAPSAYTLLVAQVVLLAVSAFFVAKTAHQLIGMAAGWLIGLAYALSWGVQQAVAVQFHEVAFAAPLLAISLAAILRRRWRTAAIWGGLLVFVKEDLGLTVLALGVVLALRSRRWLLGGLLAAWGLVWFVVTMKLILPALNPRGRYDYGDRIDAGQVLTHPFGTVGEILTNDKKMSTLLLLLACTAFLILRSSLGAVALPTLTWRFLSSTEGHWAPTWHYSLVLMPIAYLAVVDAVDKLKRSRVPFFLGYARHAPAVVFAFALAISNQLPLWDLHKPQTWEHNQRHDAAAAVVHEIPREATVATDVSLMSYLVTRADVYYIGQEGNPVVDYVVVDNLAGGWNTQVEAAEYASQIYPGTRWEKVFDKDSYQVAKHVG